MLRLTSASECDLTPATLVELLAWRAAHQPDQLAYTFLVDGETEEISLSYGELDRAARAIAARLQEMSAGGTRVLLFYPPGLEYISAFFGCLYAGAVAVPMYPPRLNRNMLRLESVMSDAQARIALTTEITLSRIMPLFAHAESLTELQWLSTDTVSPDLAQLWQEPLIHGDTIAFLQYTSGSTATPKGVMVSHANLLSNEEAIRRACRHTERSTFVGWLPLYHDMGLIGNVLQPLYLGSYCVLMSPTAFLQRPFRWLQAISRYRGATSGGPNFAYDLCVRKISAREREGLDLSSWTTAFNGAEPVHAATIERFAAAFAPCGFRREALYPCYGLAEATLFVTGALETRPPVYADLNSDDLEQHRVIAATTDGSENRTLVACGRALPEVRIVIVNPETLIACRPDEVGEIWMSGPSVARGYWNKPEETAETFAAHLADTGAGPFLRTGDLGFMRSGELFVTGRIKDLIIIRGRNHYPQDIERTVEQSHRALRPGCGAAFSIEAGGEERLVIVQELEPRYRNELEEVFENIRRAVGESHEIQVHHITLIKAGTIFKTSSGKIQRHACSLAFRNGSLETIAQWHEPASEDSEDSLTVFSPERDESLTTWLTAQVASKLHVNPLEVDINRPIIQFGLDSLMAFELMHAIEQRLGATVSVVSFFQDLSIAQLATLITTDGAARVAAAPKLTPSRRVSLASPLSYGQRAIWFIQKLAPESAAYNIVSAARIDPELDVDALRRAFQSLVDRHPTLRTTFTDELDEHVQQVRPSTEVCFAVEDASEWSEQQLHERLLEEAYRPFKLDEPPLFRVGLFKDAPGGHALLLTIHHIIADFWSLEVLLSELGSLYTAEIKAESAALPELGLQYADYTRWQNALIESEEGTRQWDYWRKQLSSPLSVLNLPTDRPRPALQTYRGRACSFTLDADQVRRLKILSQENEATLYMTMLAAFIVLLHRYTNQEDIIIGSPTAGRSSAELANLVGYFVNPLALRINVHGNPRFESLLAQVRQTALAAFEHQDFPFPLLVERLQPARDASLSPVFQTMFVLQRAHRFHNGDIADFIFNRANGRIRVGNLTLESIGLEQRTSQLDLTLMLVEAGDSISGSFQYNTDIFDAKTVERMDAHYEQLLSSIIADPRQRVSELEMLRESERSQLLFGWNDTATDHPLDLCLHQFFEQQVSLTPDATALIFEDRRLSYAQLNEQANRLAHRLRRSGVGADSLVAVLMERSVEMVISLFAILKAGGAYVPLDPQYPHERLLVMLEDATPQVLLTQSHLRLRVPAQTAEVIEVDADRELESESVANIASEVGPENLAYVIYTSGSTGKPKGVMVPHRGVCNRLLWMQEVYGLDQSDRVLQKTPFSFDVSVWEFFWPLMTGAALVVAKPAGHKDSGYLLQLIASEGVTTLHFVPPMLRVFLEEESLEECASVKRVICSGEALSWELQEKFFARIAAPELHNLYGPTEASIDVTWWQCERGETRREVPIGRPIANTQVYVLDTRMEPVATGVVGDLYLGGVGLARGYLGRPELSAERFVPHPFSRSEGERLYRTGDLARWRSEGVLEFNGRVDGQVKVRGFRIETGEIESVLNQHPHVRESVVVVKGDEQRLIAYLTAEDTAPASEALRSFAKERLPEYMLPSQFVMLDTIPLTPNGKVDRKALPEPEMSRREPAQSYVAPRNATEELLVEIWAQVLKIDRVGIHDNFFDLGGHSLLVAKIVAKVREQFGLNVAVSKVFDSPTVFALASELEAYAAQPNVVRASKIMAVPRGRRSIESVLEEV